MKFKRPRDPNTDPKLHKIRDILPSEGLLCQVGRGECPNLASESQDDGEGGEFRLCPKHALEFRDLSVLIAEMTPNQLNAFERSILTAEAGFPPEPE